MGKNWILLALVVPSLILGCGGGGGGGGETATTELADELNSAVSYMGEALPDIDTAAFHVNKKRSMSRKPLTANTLLGVWDTSTSADMVTVPGGAGSGCTDPIYNGQDLETNTNASIKDYIGMSLDPDFQRCSDGGSSDYYKPTIFGRLANAIMIIGYLDSFLPKDSTTGVFTNGSGTETITVDGQEIDIQYSVADAAVTTYYDKALYIRGLQHGTSNQLFVNLMWIRNSSTELNFGFMESGDHWDGGNNTNGEDGDLDSITYSYLKYNKSSGQMAFEYVSDSAETTAGTDPSNPNLESFRLFISGSGAAAQLSSYSGKSKTSATGYTAFTIYGPNGESSSSVSVSVNHEDATNTLTGVTCVALPATTASGTTVCSGQTAAADISSSLGAATSTIVGYQTLAEVLEGKGFDSSTASSLDWSDSTVRSNYLADGAAISVGFSSMSSMMTATDGTP